MSEAPVLCAYCRKPADLVSGSTVYPHRPDLSKLSFWLCRPCDAWVGCHRDTIRPLGRLADAELRRAKLAAHAAFDPFWKSRGWSRGNAYKWLATKLGIPSGEAHIGMFDVKQCRRVVEVVREHRNVERTLDGQ